MAQITARLPVDLLGDQGILVEEHVDAPGHIGQVAAAVRGNDFDVGIAVEETVDDHAGNTQRRVEHEAEAGHQHPFAAELGFLGAEGGGGVDQHRQGAVVQGLPDGLEQGIDQMQAADVGQGHDADGARIHGPVQFGQGQVRILPGDGGQVADAVRVGGLSGGHLVVGEACRFGADFGVAPENVG